MKNLLKTFEKYGGCIYGIVYTISFFTILYATDLSKRPFEESELMFIFIRIFFISVVIGLIVSFLTCLAIDVCKKERSEQIKLEKVITEEKPVEKAEKESSICPLCLVLTFMFLFGFFGFLVGLVLVEIFKTSMGIAFLMASAFAILGFIASVFVVRIFDISESLDNIKKAIEELKQSK